MWLWGCLTPHPPIIVGNIGGGRESEAKDTIEAMEDLAKRLSERRPDSLLVLSPHAASIRGLVLLAGNSYEGDMGGFGHPEISMKVDGDIEAATELGSYLHGKIPVEIYRGEKIPLDHGAFVPLWFFKKEWNKLPPIVLANPIGLRKQDAYTLGKRLSSMQSKRSWGLLASGDLSHRLTPDAPAGYSPDGRILDDRIVEALKKGNPDPIYEMDSAAISRAGECGLRSAMTLMALIDSRIDVLSYEGPYGVGYCVAVGLMKNSKCDKGKTHPTVTLARKTLEEFLKGKMHKDGEERRYKGMSEPKACFVSLKKAGRLRGCIGTLSPVRESLADEIESNAIAAATADPRFLPVAPDELDDITISVDVLSEPEKVTDLSQLDPKRYGVIVSKGRRRGVLLPDLEGVDSVDQQLSIAASKAGLPYTTDLEIERFTVERHGELDGD